MLFIFGFVGVIGVLVFADVIPLFKEDGASVGRATLWGMIRESEMRDIVSDFNKEYDKRYLLNYRYVEESSFEDELISALAKGEGPDMVIFPYYLIVRQSDKLITIPYENYSVRDFKNNFVETGELFLASGGVTSIPLYTDPLVMYWNRSLFSNAGLSIHPKNWTEFLKLPELLTKKDSKGNIFQSTIAFGTYSNINNAKDILATLLFQSGENIIERVSNQGSLKDSFKISLNTIGGVISAINFFTEFSNPAKSSYSWNTSMSNSKNAFESEKLAVYFGRASEYSSIKRNNPNLNFDVALMPQRSESTNRVTFGDMKGLSVLKTSKSQNAAISISYILTSSKYASKISKAIYLPSLRRDILASRETDPILSVFNESALISRSWYDPNKKESDIIFREIIEAVISGRRVVSDAINNARIRLMDYVK